MSKRAKGLLGSLAAIVVVAVLFSFALDSFLTRKAHDAAEEISRGWGRPVVIGSVSTHLLTGFGVRVSDVSIGAAPGEPLPLAEVKRVEVRAGLLRAALSAGKDVVIHSAAIEGLTVNVIRLKEGDTNLERFQKRILKENPAKPKEPDAGSQTPSDLSFLHIEHAELSEGQVALVDESGATPKQLGVKHLDLRVDDLEAGKPLDLLVKAAVLADNQNFTLKLHSAPLPKTLQPTPETLNLHVAPAIDLRPLGPFAGKEVGLEAGTFDADFDAKLGAAVPGGEGPTAVKGAVNLRGLRFRGAEGGKALDVVLDTDVTGDAQKGDVQIAKLRLDLGPAGLSGKGRASGLATPSPRVEGLEVVSHDLDLDKLAAYYPPLAKQLPGTFAGPIGLSLHASGSQEAQALELVVDLTQVRLAVPKQLDKAAGAPMTLTAHVRGAAATGGPIRFDAKLDLAGADLRPGGSLNKGPGERLDLALEGTRSSKGAGAGLEQKLELQTVKAHLLADELEAHGGVEMKGAAPARKTRFELQVASSHLDLDRLLLPSQSKEEKKPLDPALFAGLSGHAKAKLDLVRVQKQEFRDVVADVSMQEDRLQLTTAELKAFGGRASASGTELRLAHPHEPFHAVVKLDGLAAENTLALFSDHKLLTGKLNAAVDLHGGGELAKDLAQTLAGSIEGHVLDGAFFGKDLVSSVTGPLGHALPFGLAGKEGKGGSTTLGKDLPFGVTLKDGIATLKQPLSVTTPEAGLSFGGGVRLDGQLNLDGAVNLAPQTVAALTGGKAKPSQPIPVKVKLTGFAWSPQVSDLDLKPAVAQIVKDAGAAAIGSALGIPGGDVKGAVEQKKSDVQAEAQKRAQAEQDRAKAAAQEQQKKVEQQAQDKLKGLFGR